jgi:hypothetical protein
MDGVLMEDADDLARRGLKLIAGLLLIIPYEEEETTHTCRHHPGRSMTCNIDPALLT